MTKDAPREYDKEFTTPVDASVRRRLGINVTRGKVTRFIVQLEYCLDPRYDNWITVVRYDHDAKESTEATHDVTEDGLHIDIYRDGENYDSHELTPPLPANDALETTEDHLSEHLDRYIRRFEQWHGITPTNRWLRSNSQM